MTKMTPIKKALRLLLIARIQEIGQESALPEARTLTVVASRAYKHEPTERLTLFLTEDPEIERQREGGVLSYDVWYRVKISAPHGSRQREVEDEMLAALVAKLDAIPGLDSLNAAIRRGTEQAEVIQTRDGFIAGPWARIQIRYSRTACIPYCPDVPPEGGEV